MMCDTLTLLLSIDKFLQALTKYQNPIRLFNLHCGYRSISMEVIATYCFAKSFAAIDFPNFQHSMIISLGSSDFILFVIQHFPFLTPFILAMPHWLGRLRGSNSLAFKKYMATLGAQIEKLSLIRRHWRTGNMLLFTIIFLEKILEWKHQRKRYEINLRFCWLLRLTQWEMHIWFGHSTSWTAGCWKTNWFPSW